MRIDMIYDDSLERWEKYVNAGDFVFRAYSEKKITKKEWRAVIIFGLSWPAPLNSMFGCYCGANCERTGNGV
jgi:hypothetical protein